MATRNNSTIYVGGLPSDMRKHEFMDLFEKYGSIVDAQFVPGRMYNFIQFANRRDALEAVEGRNDCLIDGFKLKVEMSRGMWGPPPTLPKHTKHRVIVKNLPCATTWQQLKDHMKMAGTVCFADVKLDGKGVIGLVEYMEESRMNYAIRMLNNSKFRNRLEERKIVVERDAGRTETDTEAPENNEDQENELRTCHKSSRSSNKHSRSTSTSPEGAHKRRKV